MMNPFSWSQQAPTDQSVALLYQIFGNMNNILCNPSLSNCTQNTAGITMGAMFQAFNGVILAIAALMVVYITVVGVLKTAHEGEFMGKQGWNTLWTPLRVVFGIGLLVPTASGFSGIQIVMMWVIVQGIGAADYMWNTALKAVSIAGNPTGNVTIPNSSVTQSMQALFGVITCEQAALFSGTNPYSAGPSPLPSYYCGDPTNALTNFCKDPTQNPSYTSSSNPQTISFGPGGACGSMTLCNQQTACPAGAPQSIACLACTAQIAAMTGPNGIVSVMQGIAAQFVQADNDYLYFTSPAASAVPTTPAWITNACQGVLASNSSSNNGSSSNGSNNNSSTECTGTNLSSLYNPNDSLGQGPSSQAVGLIWQYNLKQKLADNGNVDIIGTSVGQYINAVTGAVNQYIQEQINTNQGGNSIAGINSSNGWIYAGEYYLTLASTSNANLVASMPALSVTSLAPSQGNVMYNYRSDSAAALALLTAAAGTNANQVAATLPALGSAMNSAASSVSQVAFQFFPGSNAAPSKQNVLTSLAQIGQGMIIAAELIFVAFLEVTAILAGLGFFDVFVLGSGVSNPVGPTLTTIYFLVVPALFGLLTWLISTGALLSIYVPMIPYLVFTIGAIGWFISTIEAMVAAPLVALGILTPSAHGHEILGKAEPALMLLFNIFMRPTLMVFGMMAAMILATVVVGMIHAGFGTVASQAYPTWQGDLVAGILFISAYIMFIITALNKVFALIHIIPDRVGLWISGQAGQGAGEAEALGEQKRGVEGAASAAGGAVAGVRASEGAGEKGQSAAKARKEKSEGSNVGISSGDK